MLKLPKNRLLVYYFCNQLNINWDILIDSTLPRDPQ